MRSTKVLAVGLLVLACAAGARAAETAAPAFLYGPVSAPWRDSFTAVFADTGFAPKLGRLLNIQALDAALIPAGSDLWAPVERKLQALSSPEQFSSHPDAQDLFLQALREAIPEIQREAFRSSALATSKDTPVSELPYAAAGIRQVQRFALFLTPDQRTILQKSLEKAKDRYWEETEEHLLAKAAQIERELLERPPLALPAEEAPSSEKIALPLAPSRPITPIASARRQPLTWTERLRRESLILDYPGPITLRAGGIVWSLDYQAGEWELRRTKPASERGHRVPNGRDYWVGSNAEQNHYALSKGSLAPRHFVISPNKSRVVIRDLGAGMEVEHAGKQPGARR